jgi:hypothetical protein
MVAFDQSKAFDRISHSFISFILEAFNFGKDMKGWVSKLYNEIESALIIGGFISRSFKVKRSVRQGCGLSPTLYALCIELLANRISSSLLFKGVPIPGSKRDLRFVLHADDLTVFAADLQSLNLALREMEVYCKASGSVINKEKTQAMQLGFFPLIEQKPEWLPLVESLKIFGIHFGKQASEKNEVELLEKITKSLNAFKKQFLTLLGKVVIINNLVVPKIMYYLQTIHFKKPFFKKIERKFYAFIWPNTEWLSRTTVKTPRARGGLGLHDIQLRADTINLKFAHSILKNPHGSLARYAIFWMGRTLRILGLSWDNSIPHSETSNLFHEGVSITVKTQHNAALLLARNKLNSKAIYSALQKANFQEPRINRIHPGINFESMWRALSYKALNPQARDLAFKITHKILPTKDFLGKYKIIKNPICCLCKTQTESIQHTFKFCSRIKPILSFYNAATDNSEQETDLSLFQLTNDKDDLQQFKLIVKTELALEVWKTRNRLEKKQGEIPRPNYSLTRKTH